MIIDRQDGFLRSLFFKADLVAHQADHPMACIRCSLGGKDIEPHDGVLLAADKLDNFVEADADDFLDRAILTLANADDAISDRQLPG
ncbi:hypothetical protein D3C73_1254040 [compost metagenome]